jgi:hypothetical protein
VPERLDEAVRVGVAVELGVGACVPVPTWLRDWVTLAVDVALRVAAWLPVPEDVCVGVREPVAVKLGVEACVAVDEGEDA